MRSRALRILPALLAATTLTPAPALAARLTLGSDLKAPASLIEAHGADTAFWPMKVGGSAFRIPVGGQILEVRVKGTVLSERGAASPANMIHFQSLDPAQPDGSRKVFLTSQPFYLPVDQPNVVTTFRPENLCVRTGGSVTFNDIGGFHWGGSLDAPLDLRHYNNGAPFQIFGADRDSATARYTANDGTGNGATLSPATANQSDGAPAGTVMQGRELLMQVVLATGQDRSEPCGGPRRHPDGSLVVAPPAMHVVLPQRAYVSHERSVRPLFYCAGPQPCRGTGRLVRDGRTLATGTIDVGPAATARIPMRLTAHDYRALLSAPGDEQAVRLVLDGTGGLGTFTGVIKIVQ